ncbi:hypothetical protein DSECCO2_361170 [anaerobic digester metagenome]
MLDRERRHLVRQNIGRTVWDPDRLELAGHRAPHDHPGLEEVVEAGREHRAPRDGGQAVTRAPDPLDQPGDLARRSKLDDVLDVPDIDPQFHRGGADQGAEFAFLEPLLGVDPDLARERPVVDLDVAPPEEGVPESFGRHPGVGEDQVRTGGVKGPLDARRLGFKPVPRIDDSEVQGLGDRHGDHPAGTVRAAEEPPDLLGVADRRREPDPLELARVGPDPLERDRELGPALGTGELVDLVDDHIPDPRQVLSKGLAHEERLEGLGGRDQQVGRVEGLLAPFGRGGVSVADAHPEPEGRAPPLHPGEDVPVEGPERGDVDRREAGARRVKEAMKDRKHRRLGLAGPRWRDQEQVPAGNHLRDGQLLRLGEPGKSPFGDCLAYPGVEVVERGHPARSSSPSSSGGARAAIGPRRVPSASKISTVSFFRQRETGLEGSATILRTSYPASSLNAGTKSARVGRSVAGKPRQGPSSFPTRYAGARRAHPTSSWIAASGWWWPTSTR